MNKCLYCGESVKNKYCNTTCQNRHLKPKRKKERIIITKNCKKCNQEFSQEIIKEGSDYIKEFCSVTCSHSRLQTDEMNKSRSLKLQGKTENRKCEHCENEFEVKSYSKKRFCSILCSNRSNPITSDDARKGGLNSSTTQSEKRRSKNEILFAKLCTEYFKKVETNKQIFNGWDADVIIDDIKIAVLWNGKWHYEKITKKHSVIQVQNRDKIKIKEIKKCGYTPYVIKDMGKYNPEFVNEEFNKFINYMRGA